MTKADVVESPISDDDLVAKHAIGLIDHTSLGLDDTEEGIRSLVDAAVAEVPHTAAICIYPKFVKFVRQLQKDNPEKYPRTLRVATVVNFPSGKEDLSKVLADTKQAVADGADEVDMVIDYDRLKEKHEVEGATEVESLVRAVREACPVDTVLLKVIVESGELQEPKLITTACEGAISGGCDFVKTSTGKVKINATPESAEIMLRAAAAASKPVGFKAAGGVKDLASVKLYLGIAARTFFDDESRWKDVDASRFRFGASSLLGALRPKRGEKRKAETLEY